MFIDRYLEHNQQIRQYFSGRNDLLEICIETDVNPWKTICDFLDINTIPNKDSPHADKGNYG